MSYKADAMLTKKINSNTIRRINAARVFHGIHKQPGISPRGLSKITGIDLATISIILTTLEQDGVVLRRTEAPTGRSGRPNSTLFINEASGVLAGVAVEVEEIHIVLSSFSGARLGSLRVPGSLSQEAAAAAIKNGILALLRQVGIPRKRLAGVGVGVPGLVGLDGRIALAPALDWHDADLAGVLTAGLGVAVHLENDIKAAAIAEHIFGSCQHTADFVYVSGRSGVGGGLYLGGAIYRGPHGLAGEVGHMKLVPHGRSCACGAHGCFEAYVSEHAILKCLAEAGESARDIPSVRAAALEGNEVVLRTLEEAGRHLGLGLANLANLLAPSSIILGGGMAALAEFLLPACRPEFEANTLAEIRCAMTIALSALQEFAIPMGGIAIALQHFLEEPGAIRA
ncbi:ROK family transcriptional regulator [Acidocella aquatica]|uniref:ROK family transcriptional regulator n=1 Tax=Acidocella aquatica TaxID=1922313 RepID=UPI0024E078CE|nr:ROK family transcriptional regulator [Acidocella aquatica]